MADEERRHNDGLRAIDGLLETQLGQPSVDGRALANLAVAMATEYSGARRGTLLLDRGDGLRPVLALGPELEAAQRDASAYDAELVRRIEGGAATAVAGNGLAAAIPAAGGVRGVLYLEREGGFPQSVLELAQSVAARIGHLLRSAELVSELSRRSRNLELLEALTSCLTTGRLAERHLEEILDAALRATSSDEAIMALVDASGELETLLVRGDDAERLESEGASHARALASGAEPAAAGDDRPTMRAPLESQAAVAQGGDQTPPETLGFLLVRRAGADTYDGTDRQFFRALAHLVTGALERRNYYQRAAEDPLTGTGSRLALQLSLDQLQAGADRTGVPFSLIIVDVDNFKQINDRHGHLEGDRILRGLARTLRSRLRDQDFLARYGGDEFVALLPSTDAEGAAELAEELRRRVRLETRVPQGMALSVSMGVVTYPDHAAELARLIDLGDRALYASKAAGRDCVTVAERG